MIREFLYNNNKGNKHKEPFVPLSKTNKGLQVPSSVQQCQPVFDREWVVLHGWLNEKWLTAPLVKCGRFDNCSTLSTMHISIVVYVNRLFVLAF